jgi:hypothetical protein
LVRAASSGEARLGIKRKRNGAASIAGKGSKKACKLPDPAAAAVADVDFFAIDNAKNAAIGAAVEK